MTVFRVNKDKENPYMMVNKFFIHDNRLSLKAKGLMSYFLSRPDDWEFYVSEIKKHTTDKETSISNAIKELIENGYIKRTSKREENGKFKGGYDYEVYETPVNIVSNETACTEYEPKLENPESGKSRTGEIPNWENQRLLNNECLLNNEGYYRKEVEDIISYYCSKALVTEVQLKPTEIKAVIKLVEDNIPINLVKQGIDIAFNNFKPSFEGDKIKTFKYCDPVIRGLNAKYKVKKEGADNGSNKNNFGEELRQQGIGI